MTRKINYFLLFSLIISLIYIAKIQSSSNIIANSVFTTAQAGSALDPIITKSYFDKRIAEIVSERDQIGSNYLKFIVLELKKGQIMLFGESAEFILRSGELSVYDYTTNGIADLSDGDTKFHDMKVSKNHHMLNPRNDGRGVVAITDCFIMVKGDYKIAE